MSFYYRSYIEYLDTTFKSYFIDYQNLHLFVKKHSKNATALAESDLFKNQWVLAHLGKHPGETLKEILEEKDISQRAFAAELGISFSQFNEILNGKRPIGPELAVLLEAALGISAGCWTTLQSQYQLKEARQDYNTQQKVKSIQVWTRLKSAVPLQYFKQQGVLGGGREQDENVLKQIYGVVNLLDILDLEHEPKYSYFRKSDKLKHEPVNIIGWLKYVEYAASTVQASAFQFEREISLLQELKAVFLRDNIISNAESTLAKYGIILVIKDKPDKVPVDGVLIWQGARPVIGLTLRHKRIDNLLFTIFHELGHLFIHCKRTGARNIYIDTWEDKHLMELQTEEEANVYAKDHLIHPEEWRNFTETSRIFSDSIIASFARKMGIPPATVRGRLCKESKLAYNSKTFIDYTIR